MPLLEVCVETSAAAIEALRSGASRIELCTSLDVGGLSPSFHLIEEVMRVMDAELFGKEEILPLQIMVRFSAPSFVYSEFELDKMVDYIAGVKNLNDKMKEEGIGPRRAFFTGFVFGCLKEETKEIEGGDDELNGELKTLNVEMEKRMIIDEEKTKILIQASRPFSVTFHRAFDEIEDKENAIKCLYELSVDRILTSGGKGDVNSNFESLAFLTKLSHQLSCDHNYVPMSTSSSDPTSNKNEMEYFESSSSHCISIGKITSPKLSKRRGRIILMPGGGVRSHNAQKLIDYVGAEEIHSSSPFFITSSSLSPSSNNVTKPCL
jgi:copper homeostasis protein CutC